jgi:hypothetical protein
LEQGSNTCAFINPNKYLSAKYAVALREHILAEASLLKLLDVSGISVFAQVAVYPVVSFMLKNPHQNSEVTLVLPVLRQTEVFDGRNFYQSSIPAKLLESLPENIWGFLLSTKIELLLKLIKGTSMLSDAGSINASSTAAESDNYGAYIQTKPTTDALKLVNTGTIEKFVSLWGIEELTHAGKKYISRPICR